MKSNCPNYHAIYADIISFKKGENLKAVDTTLNTCKFKSSFDVLEFNSLLFPKENVDSAKLKSYTLKDIKYILKIMKTQGLSIRKTAFNYKISRTTLSKWIKLYGSKEIS